MAQHTVITYTCPKCRVDIARQFGLLSTKMIVCPKCGANVRIDGNVIAQNWGYNFAWIGGLLIWLALGAAVLADPKFAETVGNKAFPAATLENRIVLAGLCAIPAMMLGLLCGGLGMMLGAIVAACAPATSAPAVPDYPGSPTAAPPQPQERGCLIRMIFILVWPVVFFFGAAIVISMVATFQAGDDKEMQRLANEEMAKKSVLWLLLGTLFVFILGCAGVLPLTGPKKKS